MEEERVRTDYETNQLIPNEQKATGGFSSHSEAKDNFKTKTIRRFFLSHPYHYHQAADPRPSVDTGLDR